MEFNYRAQLLKEQLVRILKYQKTKQVRNSFGVYPNRYDDLKCIYIHIPRTGGVSVCKALFKNLGGSHRYGTTLRMLFGRDFDRYFKFSFVRNPYDRVYSAYNFLKAGGMVKLDLEYLWNKFEKYESFESFVKEGLIQDGVFKEKVHFYPQWYFLYDERGEMMVDYLGYYENLAQDFENICEKINVNCELPYTNASKKGNNTLEDVYDKEMKKIVYDLYKEDFRLLGYKP